MGGAIQPIDPNIRAEIINNVRHNGMRVSEAATKYNVNARTIYGWLKQGVVDGNRNLILENNKLKRELDQAYRLLGRATAEMQKSKD